MLNRVKSKLVQAWRALRPLTDDQRRERNIQQCTVPNEWDRYFDLAEDAMEKQWDTMIWPKICEADFSTTLEIAPGAGRNSAKLAEVAQVLYLVDVNDYALAKCRVRFEDYRGPCAIHYCLNDGCKLPQLKDDSVTFVYSWDAMVHFDATVIRGYLHEFARVMRHGATGFLHHSNFGTQSSNIEFKLNPHWRNIMTAEQFALYAREVGLVCDKQFVIDWGTEKNIDCISVIRKP